MEKKESLLRTLYFEMFSISRRIDELMAINTFPGDDYDKSYELTKLEIKLLKDRCESLNNIVNMAIEL